MAKPDVLSPWLLLACLNTPIVRKQVRAKQFTQDIIDTLGKRVAEIILPVPRDGQVCRRIAEETRYVIETRIRLRNRASELALEVEGITLPSAEDIEIWTMREESAGYGSKPVTSGK